MLLEPARRVVAACALRPSRDTARIVAAGLGEDAGMIGAALFARSGGAA
jgi:glucokinase